MNGEAPGPRPDDQEVVERARSGEERAFDLLVRRHQDAAYRVALGILKDPDRAADAVQDGFLKAFGALDGFRGDAAFRTWLLTIVANQARSALRSAARRRETPLDEVAPAESPERSPAQRAVDASEAARARRHLERLPDKQRMAVTLRIEEGLSFREIGELIDSSEGAARVNYHHGVRRLRERLAASGGEDR